MLTNLRDTNCQLLYDELRKRVATDTHRNSLAEAKTFGNWCVKQEWMSKNPFAEIVGQGKRNHGKEQLRIDEARRWDQTAMELVGQGEVGAIAARMALLMGMRASEIAERVVRDLDNEGQLLWIPRAKTEGGRRQLAVPDTLRQPLMQLARGRDPEEPLFGRRYSRSWPRYWVRKICRLAGVPEVSAHGMRGLHSTLAEGHGETAHAVARSLGHASPTTTRKHYTQPHAVSKAEQERALRVLDGGRR